MKKINGVALALFTSLIVLTVSQMCLAQSSEDYALNRIILKFKEGLLQSDLNKRENIVFFNRLQADELNTKYKCIEAKYIGPHKKITTTPLPLSTFVLTFASDIDVKNIITEYMQTGLFEYVEPDYIGHAGAGHRVMLTPNDTRFNLQWGLYNNGSFPYSPSVAGADIDMLSAWDIEQGDSTIIVGILDSGTKLDHPEFNGRIWQNYDEIPGNALDDDGNGYIDDRQGWDFAYNTNTPNDGYGHGTNVAGLVGANGNNGNLYAGVDWNCKLMICRNLDSMDVGYYSWWANSMYYAVDNGARVLNMSEGGSSPSAALQSAMDYAYSHNVFVAVCMQNQNTSTPYYPAACTHAFGVGSTNSNDHRTHPFFWGPTSGSNFGPHIKVVAPGNYIFGLDFQSNTGYFNYWGGTSQATPLVAGVAALLLAQDPSRTPDDLSTIITSTAEDQVGDLLEDTPGWDQYYGFGRLNARNALNYSLGISHNTGSESRYSVFPNPAKTSIRIATNETITFVLSAITSQKLFEKTITSSENTLGLESLQAGVYLYSIKKNNVVVSTGKIVKL